MHDMFLDVMDDQECLSMALVCISRTLVIKLVQPGGQRHSRGAKSSQQSCGDMNQSRPSKCPGINQGHQDYNYNGLCSHRPRSRDQRRELSTPSLGPQGFLKHHSSFSPRSSLLSQHSIDHISKEPFTKPICLWKPSVPLMAWFALTVPVPWEPRQCEHCRINRRPVSPLEIH